MGTTEDDSIDLWVLRKERSQILIYNIVRTGIEMFARLDERYLHRACLLRDLQICKGVNRHGRPKFLQLNGITQTVYRTLCTHDADMSVVRQR